MAGAFDELEGRVDSLLAQNGSDECAERADVVAQLRVLGSKLDFAAQGASAGMKSRAAATPHAARSSEARPSLVTGIASPFCSTRLARRASLKAYAAGHTPTARACPATSSSLTITPSPSSARFAPTIIPLLSASNSARSLAIKGPGVSFVYD